MAAAAPAAIANTPRRRETLTDIRSSRKLCDTRLFERRQRRIRQLLSVREDHVRREQPLILPHVLDGALVHPDEIVEGRGHALESGLR